MGDMIEAGKSMAAAAAQPAAGGSLDPRKVANVAGGLAGTAIEPVYSAVSDFGAVAESAHGAVAAVGQVGGATTTGLAPSPSVAKAMLIVEGGEPINFQFNPADLSFSKSSSWAGGDAKGRNAPGLRFQSGQSETLRLNMTLDDTVDTGWKSVKERVEQLKKLVRVEKSLPSHDPQRASARPPWVIFRWGPIESVKSVVDSVSVRYTYFKSDGTPLRAKVDLSLKQWEDDTLFPKTNPTSGTPEPHSIHHLNPGETLDRVAATHYRDPGRWRLIAEANGICDPLRLRPGSALMIPELPVEYRG